MKNGGENVPGSWYLGWFMWDSDEEF